MSILSRHSSSCADRARGFTIVELMVAMAISLLLLGGVVAIFTSSKTTYETVERLSRIQENGRFALDAIVRDVRSAGYVGCSRPATFANTLRSQTQLAWNFTDAVAGYNFQSGTTWLPALDAAMTNVASGATNGSDALVLRVPVLGGSSASLRLTAKMGSQSGALQIAPVASSATGPLKSNEQVIMVADCHARAVFEITNYDKVTGVIEHGISAATTTTPGNASADIGHAFEANSQIVPMQTVAYYIGSSSGRTGLWRVVGGGAAEELIEGVERMELRFGEDTNADRIADLYRRADEVADWGDVISVSIALLVRSADQYGTRIDSQNYTLLDKTFTAPGDRHMRQVFVTTATLRNRAL